MDILIQKDQGIWVIELNRPDKKNALTAAMYQTMADTFQAAQYDQTARVIIIKGQPTIFTAGNDLADFLHNPPSHAQAPVFQFLNQLSHARQPVIAIVEGSAIGIGTTMLLHCDLVYANEHAIFSTPFAHLGVCPEAASSWLLPRLVGHQRAAEKLLLGEPFSAEEAKAMGLVNQVCSVEAVYEHAMTQARKLCALPQSSIETTKQFMKLPQRAAIEAQMEAEHTQFRHMLAAPEAQAALHAFLEKRTVHLVKGSSHES